MAQNLLHERKQTETLHYVVADRFNRNRVKGENADASKRNC